MSGFAMRRTVFVDGTAFAALASASAAHHSAVAVEFEHLLAEYERGDTILVTHAGMADPAGDGVLTPLSAVCDVEPLRPDLVREAERTRCEHPELHLDLDQAAALVVMERQHISEILTVDERYEQIDVARLPG